MASSIPVPKDFVSWHHSKSSVFVLTGWQNSCLYTPLAEADPEVAKIIEDETWRQFSGLELIASEVCVDVVRLLYISDRTS